MTDFLSKLISLLFHPVFMPLFTLWLVFNSDNAFHLYFAGSGDLVQERAYVLSLYAVFFLTTVLMPSISFYILKRNGLVQSLAMRERQERFAPYLSTVFYYGLLYFVLRNGHYPQPFLSAVLGSGLVVLAVTILNSFFKISAHSAGIAGVVAIYAVLLKQQWISNGQGVLFALILLTGIVCTARLSLKAHRAIEIYIGAAVGFFILLLTMSYKLYL